MAHRRHFSTCSLMQVFAEAIVPRESLHQPEHQDSKTPFNPGFKVPDPWLGLPPVTSGPII